MPIKTQELCEKCKYAFGDYCIGGGCTVCLMKTNDKNRCKCLTIKKGQDCPYYTPKADESPKEAETVMIRTATIVKPKHAIPCLICGETARVTDDIGLHIEVCEKCKAAVLKMREHLEHDPLQPILD